MQRLSEQIYESLKQEIFKADEGAFFSVRKCAAQLGMSYTPVREALLRLHNEGLLERVPNVGFFVRPMDMKTASDIYQSRECVEHYVIARVLPLLEAVDIAHLQHCIDTQAAALESGDIPAFTSADAQFHLYLIDKLGNRKLSDFYQVIRNHFKITSNRLQKQDNLVPIQEHQAFLDAAKSGKLEEAELLYHRHTKNALIRMGAGLVQIG